MSEHRARPPRLWVVAWSLLVSMPEMLSAPLALSWLLPSCQRSLDGAPCPCEDDVEYICCDRVSCVRRSECILADAPEPRRRALPAGDARLFPSACGEATNCDAVAEFSGVWGSASDDVWVIGTASRGNERMSMGVHWDSERWLARPLPVDEPTAICGAARDDVWIVGRGGRVAHFEDGAWRLHPAPAAGDADLWACWSDAAGSLWVAGDAGTLQRWTGVEWRDSSLPTAGRIEALAGSAPDRAWAAGESGLLVYWNGQSWRQGEEDPVELAGTNLHALHIDANGTTWLVGDGLVARHDGARWAPVDTRSLALPPDAWRAVIAAPQPAPVPQELWIASSEGHLAGIFFEPWGGQNHVLLEGGGPLVDAWRAPTGEAMVVGGGGAALLLREDLGWARSPAENDGTL